jgi:integrase/recombinase XerD
LKVIELKNQGKKRLDVAAAEYKDEVNRSAKKPRTKSAYCKSVDIFLESCTKIYLQDVDRTDLVACHAFCRDVMEMNARSCWNRFTNVLFFLKAHGITKLAKQEDWPVFTEEDVEIYEEWELRALFTSCSPEHRLLFRFFLMSGFREQEVMHLTWKDINFTASTVSVRHKPQYDWTPKAYKEREVPVPSALLHELEEAKAKATSPLVFPAPGGKPEGHMLRILKEVAAQAGLNPEDCYLHKFRATFATGCLQALFEQGKGGNAADLRTVQSWLGHKDLASTLRYLRPARGAGVQQKVDALWSSFNAPVIEANRLA